MKTENNIIRWGILGCGRIAGKFASSLKAVETGALSACASRTPGKAEAFAASHGVPHPFDRYEDLVGSPEVDAVYIATTHNFHYDNIRLALQAGKAVLCEKPITVSADEARKAVALAREKNLFLMEGMWTRFLPAMRKIRAWIDEGVIGAVRSLRADFCFDAAGMRGGRLFDPALAGGALLDAGIYPVSMASYIMGRQPETLKASAYIGESGVDELTGAVFDYGDGRFAMVSCAVNSSSANRLEINGSEGHIEVPCGFLSADVAVLTPNKGSPVREEFPYPALQGFSFEIEAVHEGIFKGWIEHPVLPHGETVAIMETMDRIREQIG